MFVHPQKSCYGELGDEESNMECQQVYDDRLEVAQRLFRAMCAQYPDRVITLFDPREAQIVARSDQPHAPELIAVEAPVTALNSDVQRA
jgi:hypothetical protein